MAGREAGGHITGSPAGSREETTRARRVLRCRVQECLRRALRLNNSNTILPRLRQYRTTLFFLQPLGSPCCAARRLARSDHKFYAHSLTKVDFLDKNYHRTTEYRDVVKLDDNGLAYPTAALTGQHGEPEEHVFVVVIAFL